MINLDGSFPPVLCQVMFMKALSAYKKASVSLGAVWDSYSTDNYITFNRAKKVGINRSSRSSFKC